jgi:hypothetical protein
MTTIINNPNNGEGTGEGIMGVIVGIIVLIIAIAIFFVYVLPAMRNAEAPKNDTLEVQVELPTSSE